MVFIIITISVAVVLFTSSISVAFASNDDDDEEELPIWVYKVIKDCKTKSGFVCEVGTTIDPCQDIFFGFTGTDENYKPETDQFIVPDDNDNNNCDVTASDSSAAANN